MFTSDKTYECVLPNDALYLTRLQSLNEVAILIESVVNKSKLPLDRVIRDSILPNVHIIKANYPFIHEAIDVIIRDFS